MKWGHSSFRCHRAGAAVLALAALTPAVAAPATPLFTDDFEAHPAGQLPGAPWKEEMYNSGAGGEATADPKAAPPAAPKVPAPMTPPVVAPPKP